MNRIVATVTGIAALALSAACSLERDNTTYPEGEAHQIQDVETSVVMAYQPVTVKAERRGGGAIYGGAVGATGAWAAGGSDPVIAGAALLGVAAGYLIEDLVASQHDGYTYIMECRSQCGSGRGDNGEPWAVTVAQDGDPFELGQRVYVLEDPETGIIRLMPAGG